MRLIDADDLNARMYHDAFETDSDMQKWDGGCWIRYKMFENAIKDAPTIEERKTGIWTIEDCHAATYKYCCSACGAHHRARYDFCPSCGADMRGNHHETT